MGDNRIHKFKHVSLLRRINFSPKGNLETKETVINKINESDMTEKEKRDEIVRQKRIPELTHGFTTIMFYADWCGHCRNAKPVYDKICSMGKCNNTQLCAVDSDEDRGFIEYFNTLHRDSSLVRGFPTFVQFDNGVLYRKYERSPHDEANFLLFNMGVKDYK